MQHSREQEPGKIVGVTNFTSITLRCMDESRYQILNTVMQPFWFAVNSRPLAILMPWGTADTGRNSNTAGYRIHMDFFSTAATDCRAHPIHHWQPAGGCTVSLTRYEKRHMPGCWLMRAGSPPLIAGGAAAARPSASKISFLQ